MPNKIKIYLIRCLLKWHSHAQEIHSDVNNYDCYRVYFSESDDQETKFFLCESEKKAKPNTKNSRDIYFRKTRQRGSKEKNKAIKLTPSFLSGKKAEIIHHFKSEKFYFNSIEAAFISRILLTPWIIHFSKKILRKILGFAPRPAASYIEVLKAVSDHYFETGEPSSPYVVALKIDGPIFKMMPDKYRSEAMKKYLRILESLEESGEVKRSQEIMLERFNPTGKALRTLTDWDNQDNERHWQRKHSKQMLGATILIGFATLITAIPEFKGAIQEAYQKHSHSMLILVAAFIFIYFIHHPRR